MSKTLTDEEVKKIIEKLDSIIEELREFKKNSV